MTGHEGELAHQGTLTDDRGWVFGKGPRVFGGWVLWQVMKSNVGTLQ